MFKTAITTAALVVIAVCVGGVLLGNAATEAMAPLSKALTLPR